MINGLQDHFHQWLCLANANIAQLNPQIIKQAKLFEPIFQYLSQSSAISQINLSWPNKTAIRAL